MDASFFFRKSHAYLHVSLACCSTKSWPTPVLLPAAILWTSCECFGPGRTLSNLANYQFEGCSDMRLRNCSACMTTTSVIRAQQEAVPSTHCLPNRNRGASCAPFLMLSLCSVKSLCLKALGHRREQRGVFTQHRLFTFPSLEDTGGCFMPIVDLVLTVEDLLVLPPLFLLYTIQLSFFATCSCPDQSDGDAFCSSCSLLSLLLICPSSNANLQALTILFLVPSSLCFTSPIISIPLVMNASFVRAVAQASPWILPL